jgi:hypothetical protein
LKAQCQGLAQKESAGLVHMVFGRLNCGVAGSGGGEIVPYEAGKNMLQRMEEREQQQHGAGVRRVTAGPSPRTPSFGVRIARMDNGDDIGESDSEGVVVEEAEDEAELEDESEVEVEDNPEEAVYISAVKPARIEKPKPAAEKNRAEDLRRKIEQQDLLPKPCVTRRRAYPPVIVKTMDMDMGSAPALVPTKHERQASREKPGKPTAPRRTLRNEIANAALEEDIIHRVT